MSNLIESLLYLNEGTTLDFKRDQYPFENATDEQKSEFLKDILAFSNSWRQDEAYIVIGIKEYENGEKDLFGTENHIDDAKLQQFIDGKTNRQVNFSYEIHLYNGIKFGVFRIPKQERPIYSKKNYGKVKKEVVYYRLKSSTKTATPDDIASMGKDYINHIQLKADSDKKEIETLKLRQEACYGCLLNILVVTIVGIIFIYAFLLNTINNFLIWLPFILGLAIIFCFDLNPYSDKIRLYNKKPQTVGKFVYVGKGRVIEIYNNTHFIVYRPTAKCIYPHCYGKIILVNAPPREVLQTGKQCVGICSVGEKDHSYRIDNILVATPERFNWLPLDKS